MSLSDGNQVIIKSPLRSNDDEQNKAIRQLDTEMMILDGPLKNAGGIRQLIDQIPLQTSRSKETRAGVFESLDTDLHKFHLTQKSKLSRPEIKSIARQLLTALSVVHQHGIVHTGQSFNMRCQPKTMPAKSFIERRRCETREPRINATYGLSHTKHID